MPYHTLQSSATTRAGLCCQKPTKQNAKRCQRCETEELGVLCTEAIIVSHLLVLVLWQLSCLFSLTLYSSSILSNVSSDKRERDFSIIHKSGQHKVPHRAISQHWSSHRQATPNSHGRQENSLSALVCEFLKINQLNFRCRTAITGNSMFLENPSYWQVPRKLARNSNYNYCSF